MDGDVAQIQGPFSNRSKRVIDNAISYAETVLKSASILAPDDRNFPVVYYLAWMKRCLSGSLAEGMSDNDILSMTHAWGAEMGPQAYACQMVEGACKEMLHGRYYRRMPQKLLNMLDSGLGRARTDVVSYIKTQAVVQIEQPNEMQLSFDMF
jgi:hypothetical protein